MYHEQVDQLIEMGFSRERVVAAMAAHAPKVGIPQGALASATENLENFVALFSGQVWARVYAFGVARGSPALFYVIIAAVTLAQAAFVTVEMREGVAKGD